MFNEKSDEQAQQKALEELTAYAKKEIDTFKNFVSFKASLLGLKGNEVLSNVMQEALTATFAPSEEELQAAKLKEREEDEKISKIFGLPYHEETEDDRLNRAFRLEPSEASDGE